MKMKNAKKKIIVLSSIILFLILGIFIFLNTDKSPILSKIEYSGAYADKNGDLMKVFLTSDEKYRIYKPITEYPANFIQLLLEQEDKRFFEHNGVNPISVIRATFSTYILKSRVIGASTITMQTAKLVYKINSHSIFGKLKQIAYSYRLEFNHSKQEILEAYLNLAPCGKNIEGFESASWYFFGHSIHESTFDEQVMLCVLPQNPVKRCPSRLKFPDELKEAMNRLSKTADENKIELVCRFPETALHFSRLLNQKLELKNKPQKIIRTSINPILQKLVEDKLQYYVNSHASIGIENACAMLVDSKSMKIVSYVGSASFYDNSILGQIDGNISRRSPGSTLKPFIYALALEQGIIHSKTLLKDVPTSFSEYAPDNYGNDFKGPIKAEEALVQSRNIPAVSLAREIKNPDLYDFLQNAGIENLREKSNYGLSIVLGSAEITPFEEAKLYCSILNNGIEKKLEIVANDLEKELFRIDNFEEKEILTAESSFVVKKMLENNQPPNVRSQKVDWCNVGFKTGTSIGFKDAWTSGFFGDYVLIVWVGNFDGKGNNYFLGRFAAAPLFFEIADEMIERGFVSQESENQNKKLNVTEVDVCSISGCIPNEDCPKTEKALFIPGISPIEKCKIHRKVTENGKSTVKEFWSSDFMEIFELAGLPRENPLQEKIDGKPPRIISPLSNTDYFLDENRNAIILRAVGDSDAGELFWYSQNEFIAKSKPNEKVEWFPKKIGIYELTVTDSKGRSTTKTIKINDTAETIGK